MKKFSGNRPFKEIVRLVLKSGGKVAESASKTSSDADLWKNIEFNGRRFIYNMISGGFIMPPDQVKDAKATKLAGKGEYITEGSSELDAVDWYNEILDLLYLPVADKTPLVSTCTSTRSGRWKATKPNASNAPKEGKKS